MVNQSLSPRTGDISVFHNKAGFLKFYLFSMVILTHALNYESYPLATSDSFWGILLYRLELFELTLSGIVMPSYFFISGYGFMAGFSPEKTPEKLKRRFYSMFIPWLLWNSIMWLLGIAMESIPVISSHLNSGFGYEFTLSSWLREGLLLPADGPLWFISNVMVCFVLAPVIYYLVKNRYIGLVVIALQFAGIYITRANRYSLQMALLFFTQAAWYAKHAQPFVYKRYGRAARLFALAVLVVYVLTCSSQKIQYGGIYHALCFSVTTPLLWVLVGDAKLGPRAEKLEKHRFWVYCSHYLPLECVEKLWLLLAGTSLGAAWAGMLICPTVTVLLLIWADKLVRRFAHPLWCLLSGKKPRRRAA